MDRLLNLFVQVNRQDYSASINVAIISRCKFPFEVRFEFSIAKIFRIIDIFGRTFSCR